MVRLEKAVKLFHVAVLTVLIIFLTAGCSPGQTISEEPPVEEDMELEEPEPAGAEDLFDEEILTMSTYYWPWLSYGHLDLSTGETILGPDSFESDLGFIAEFTEDHSFKGLLVWPVEESDAFAIEWIRLSFNVEYYDHDERVFDLYYEFTVEGFQPEPGEEGIQEFPVNLVDLQENFKVTIKKVVLGKEQQSAYRTNLIDYVALEIAMEVVENP